MNSVAGVWPVALKGVVFPVTGWPAGSRAPFLATTAVQTGRRASRHAYHGAPMWDSTASDLALLSRMFRLRVGEKFSSAS
jgi:hypothetical protein